MRVGIFALAALALAVPAAAKDKQPFKVQSAGAAKGTQRVTVGNFTVGFVFESMDRRGGNDNAGGVAAAFGPTTKAKSILAGVDDATMQAITDAAYDDFKRQLAARGFEVVEPGDQFGGSYAAKMKASASPYEAKVALDQKGKSKGKATYWKPTAQPRLLLLAGDVTGSSAFSGFSAFGLMNNSKGFSQHARDTGTSVLSVAYLIDFSQVKRPGAWSFKGVDVNSGISVVDDFSRATVSTAKGVTILTVDDPVAVEGDFAAREDTTKGGGMQKAANVAGGVMAAFGMGGFGVGKTKTFTFTAKPAFRDGAVKAAELANTRLVDQLVALK